MDSVSQLAAKLRPYWLRDAEGGSTTVVNNYYTSTGGDGGGEIDLTWVVPQSRVLTALDGLTGGGDLSADRSFAVDNTVVRTSRLLVAGAGLAGGGDLSADRTFDVASGNTAIVVNTNDIALTLAANPGLAISSGLALGTPTAVTVSSTNTVSGAGHTHAVTSSNSVSSAQTSLLNATLGALTLDTLTLVTKLRTPLIDAAAALRLSPATHVELNPGSNLVNLLSGKSLQADNYASQTTGFRVTYAGEGDFRYLFTDELHAKAFIADLEQALAGGQIIAKSVTSLSRDFTAPAAGGATTIYLNDLPSAENMAVFQSGDIIRLRSFTRSAGSLTIADCWGVVTAYADLANKEQSWTFTRSLAPNAGAMPTSTVVIADSIVLDYGTTGNGFYEVNAIDGLYGLNSPYAQIVTWASHPHSGQTVRARLGNLRGIFSVANEYGLFVGDGVTDADAYLRLSNNTARFNNVPIRMWNSGINTGYWYPNGDLALGPADVGTNANRSLSFVASSGAIRFGQTGAGNANIEWNGTDLNIRQNTTPVITLDSTGASYFAGRMTIGASGEIVQGSGTLGTVGTWGNPWGTFTGYRIGRSGSIGLWGLYNAGVPQVYADTSGFLFFGAGSGRLSASGVQIAVPTSVSVEQPTQSYRFTYTAGATLSGLYAYADTSGFLQLSLLNNTASMGGAALFNVPAYINIDARGGAAQSAVAQMQARNSTKSAAIVLDVSTTASAVVGLYGDRVEGPAGPSGSGYRYSTGNWGMFSSTSYWALENNGANILVSRTDAADSFLRLGYNNTNNQSAYVDFFANGAAPTTQDARIVRSAGANGGWIFANVGTGTIAMQQASTGLFTWSQNAVEVMRIDASGRLGVGTNAPAALLDVDGFARAQTFIVDGDGGAASSSGGLVAHTNVTSAGATVSVWTGFLKVHINGSSYRIPYVT